MPITTPEIQDAVDLVKTLSTTPPANLTAEEIRIQINEALQQLDGLENTSTLDPALQAAITEATQFSANDYMEGKAGTNIFELKGYAVDQNGNPAVDASKFKPDGTPLTQEIADALQAEADEDAAQAAATKALTPEIQDAVDLVKTLSTTPPANLTAAEIQTQINEALSQLSNLENTATLDPALQAAITEATQFSANDYMEGKAGTNIYELKGYAVDQNGNPAVDVFKFNSDGTPLTQEIADALTPTEITAAVEAVQTLVVLNTFSPTSLAPLATPTSTDNLNFEEIFGNIKSTILISSADIINIDFLGDGNVSQFNVEQSVDNLFDNFLTSLTSVTKNITQITTAKKLSLESNDVVNNIFEVKKNEGIDLVINNSEDITYNNGFSNATISSISAIINEPLRIIDPDVNPDDLSIVGTSNSDIILSIQGSTIVSSYGGDDTIYVSNKTSSFIDVIDGGTGTDTLSISYTGVSDLGDFASFSYNRSTSIFIL